MARSNPPRNAPSSDHRLAFREIFTHASLGILICDAEGAIGTLDRALRVAGPDRPLLKAHRALVRLEHGEAELELDKVLSDLHASPAREGYGRYLLGMIAHRMGDLAGASVHLRAFLNRNAAADVAKQLTLQLELRRARSVLAEIESD